MGLIRTLLALCVAAFHSYKIGGLGFTGGKVSVQCFYIISGFYMALILNEKYSGKNYFYWSFIKGRFLRIYPSYLIVLLISFLVSLLLLFLCNNPFYFGLYIPHWNKLNIITKVILIGENFLLIGQDILFFLKINFINGQLEPTLIAFREKQRIILNGFLFVPQSWTLSIEICFYLLAPFIVRSSLKIKIGIIFMSIFSRYFFYKNLNLGHEPWTYRFFPFEMAFFCLGILMYGLYHKIQYYKYTDKIGFISMFALILLIFAYDQIPIHEELRCWYFYTIFSLMLPFVFYFTKNNKFDRLIGEFSYPIYLIHHIIMFLLRIYFWQNTHQLKWFGISTVTLSLLGGILFYFLFVARLEKYRQKFIQLKEH